MTEPDESALYEDDWFRGRISKNVENWPGGWVSNPRLIASRRIPGVFEAMANGTLSLAEAEELRAYDYLVHGQDDDTGENVYLVCEGAVEARVAQVASAIRGAALLAKAGVNSRAFVYARAIRPDAAALAAQHDVIVDLHPNAT